MPKKTAVIHATNVSEGWADIFNLVMAAPGAKAGPIVLELEAQNGVAVETPIIRQLVDEELKKHDKFSIDTTSFLIFPWKLWNMLGQPDLTRFTDI